MVCWLFFLQEPQQLSQNKINLQIKIKTKKNIYTNDYKNN